MSIATAISPHTRTIEEHPAETLVRDERVQRSLRPGHVDRLAAKLNLDAIGTVVVSRRPNGDLVILDGGHRITALLKCDLGEWPVSCVVHEGLDGADEARLFLAYNDRMRVDRIEKFRIAVTAEDPEAVRLDKLIRKHGFVTMHGNPCQLLCIDALVSVYRGTNNSERVFPQVVDDTLRVIAEAWTPEGSAIREAVSGVGHLLHRYPDLDQERLVRQLSQVKNGARGVAARCHYHKEMKAVPSVREGAVRAVAEFYNEGLHRSKKLKV